MKQTLLTITDENRTELKMLSLKNLSLLRKSLIRLSEDLTHNNKEIRENSIVMTAAICMAVEEGIAHASEEIKRNRVQMAGMSIC